MNELLQLRPLGKEGGAQEKAQGGEKVTGGQSETKGGR